MREGSEENGNEATPEPDQVMVCLSSRGPNSEMLLRYASRLAGRLNRNWYAVYVQTPSEEPTIIDASTQRVLSSTLTLAKQLGAMVFTYKGEDVADTILRFAQEYRVGHIVMGYPGEIPFWKRTRRKEEHGGPARQEIKGNDCSPSRHSYRGASGPTDCGRISRGQKARSSRATLKPRGYESEHIVVNTSNHYLGRARA